ncbi:MULTISPECIES: transposase [unclassified Gordonia (in: high G+C Gram-positive bacteria)]|uniref:transposase n=1 Tax=unclassified Gordonia (in: high G+C Gram-positive bacteria) TaxID=2657482 RepID=UPI0022B24B19|nr:MULTISPECIES: transposase [unclassified Gordonia (in: high G+C Gram-positive bacteria)]
MSSGPSSSARSRPAAWAGCTWFTSDAHAGLKRAVAEQFTGTAWQRCRVHFSFATSGRRSLPSRCRR